MIHARRLARLLAMKYGASHAKTKVRFRMARYVRVFCMAPTRMDTWVRAEHADRWAYWSLVYANLRRYF